MKLLIILLILCGCSEHSGGPVLIDVKYSGTHVIVISNKVDGKIHAHISVSDKSKTYSEDDIGEFGKLEIKAQKATGEAYPDTGSMTIKIYDDNTVYDIFKLKTGTTEKSERYIF